MASAGFADFCVRALGATAGLDSSLRCRSFKIGYLFGEDFILLTELLRLALEIR
ncbi:hypothetical protein V1289_006207 [Bradyrhizobium sp. AZCC 2289]